MEGSPKKSAVHRGLSPQRSWWQYVESYTFIHSKTNTPQHFRSWKFHFSSPSLVSMRNNVLPAIVGIIVWLFTSLLCPRLRPRKRVVVYTHTKNKLQLLLFGRVKRPPAFRFRPSCPLSNNYLLRFFFVVCRVWFLIYLNSIIQLASLAGDKEKRSRNESALGALFKSDHEGPILLFFFYHFWLNRLSRRFKYRFLFFLSWMIERIQVEGQFALYTHKVYYKVGEARTTHFRDV